MSSLELLESNVVAIRSDLADLKTDFRAAVARTDDQFREVRQDIRELRAANETLRDKIDETRLSLDAKIDATRETLDKKIDATRETLDQKIDVTREILNQKIEATRESLDQKIDTSTGELRADIKGVRADIQTMAVGIEGLRRMQRTIIWLLSGIGTVVTLVSGALGIAKTLGWM